MKDEDVQMEEEGKRSLRKLKMKEEVHFVYEEFIIGPVNLIHPVKILDTCY